MAEITVPNNEQIVIDDFGLDVPAQVNRSVWTGRRKVVGLPGASRWAFRFHIEELATELEERPWRAFLVALRGVQNKFRLRVACSQRTTGANPTVRTGPGNGYSVPLQGLPNSTTVLQAGQHMTIPLPSGHHRLVTLTAHLVTNGSGQATAQFEPDLGETPTVGATVETFEPYAMVSQVESASGWTSRDAVSGFAFDVEEAI